MISRRRPRCVDARPSWRDREGFVVPLAPSARLSVGVLQATRYPEAMA